MKNRSPRRRQKSSQTGFIHVLGIILIIVLLVALGVILYYFGRQRFFKSHAGGCPSMEVMPNPSTVAPGGSFDVTVTACSDGTNQVNAVEAKFTYDTNLLTATIDPTTYDFPLVISDTVNNGTVDINRGSTTALSSSALLTVAVVHFTVNQNATNGVTALTFDPGSQLDSSTTNQNVVSTFTNGNVTIAGAATPQPTASPAPSASASPSVSPTAAPTATPDTSGNNNSNNSQASNGYVAPACADQKPLSTPNLYQINTTQTTATLFFAPAQDPVSYYQFAYGFSQGDQRFGFQIQQGHSNGALQATINNLAPGTWYYFQVRAGNGCTPGDWSAWVSASTAKAVNSQQASTVTKQASQVAIVPVQASTLQPAQAAAPAVRPQTSPTLQPLGSPAPFIVTPAPFVSQPATTPNQSTTPVVATNQSWLEKITSFFGSIFQKIFH